MRKKVIFSLLMITTALHGMEIVVDKKNCSFEAVTDKKINYLFEVAADPEKQFTQEDLSDPSYVNMSYHIVTHGGNWTKYTPHTLLSMASREAQLSKIQKLIVAGADCKNEINSNVLLKMAAKRGKPKHQDVKEKCFAIIKLLLEHEADPDYHSWKFGPTAVMIAACYQDKELVRLLLCKYNAKIDFHDIIKLSKEHKEISEMDQLYAKKMHKHFVARNTVRWWSTYKCKPDMIFDMQTGEPICWFKEVIKEIGK